MPRKKSTAKRAKESEAVVEVPIQDSLFGADDAEDEEEFTINEEYARRFEHNKKREDLHRLQEKYKGAKLDDDDSGESSSEEEDDEGDLNTPQIDAAILKMMAKIRNKDPALYSTEAKFFEDAEKEATLAAAAKKKKTVKPTTIADVHRQTLLSGQANDDHGAEGKENLGMLGDNDRTHVQEQDELRRAFQGIGEEADSDEDLLVPRKRSAEELEAEEKEYREILEEQLRHGAEGDLLTQLKSGNTENPEGEEFLMNYVLNRGWIDKNADKVPSYDQLVDEDESDDFEDRAEKFETAYNFRFEQPGATEITTHARDVPTVRHKDEKRKKERQAKAEKQKTAKQVRMEELNRLKNLKKAELEEKIRKIEEVTGRRMDFDELDLEGDFDPDQWDKKMIDRFNDSYYQEKDDGKPTWDDDIEIDDLPIEQDDQDSAEPASTEPQVKASSTKSVTAKLTKREEKARKRKIEEMVDAAVPEALGPDGRFFRYRQSEPETFGLSIEDILFADDAKLNEYVGLKKLAAFKPTEKVERDRKKYGARKRAKQFQKELWSQSKWQDRQAASGANGIEVANGEQKRKKSKKEKK